MNHELMHSIKEGEVLPKQIEQATKKVILFLNERFNMEFDFTFKGDVASIQFDVIKMEDAIVEFSYLLDEISSLEGIDYSAVEVLFNTETGMIAIAPKGTHIRIGDVI